MKLSRNMESKSEEVFEAQNETELKRPKSISSRITVEPLVLIYILPSTINVLLTQNLILEESCRVNLGFNQSICDAIMNKNTSGYVENQEISVQKSATDVIFIKTLMHGIIPVVISFFVGSWSDKRNRRRPCILGPIIGELLAVTCSILNSVFSHKIPASFTALAYSLPMAMSGGSPCLFLGVYSYVSTCSSEENLTLRIGGVSTVQKVACVIGLGIGGIVLNYLGFIGAYTTTFFMILSSFVYGYYIIKESNDIVTDVEEELKDIQEAPKKICGEIHVIEHFLHTVRVFLTERPSNRRMRLIAAVLLTMIVSGPLKGEQSVFFLYTKYRFGWNHLHHGIFYAGQFVIEIVGSLSVLSVLVKYFKWKDEGSGILAFTSSIIASIVFALADNEILFCAGAVLNLFDGTSQIASRSSMSKSVQNHELGKTNSVFEISESLTHIIFGALYTVLYRNTVHAYPGSIFWVTAILKVIGIFIFVWLFHQSIKHKIKKEIRGTQGVVDEKL